MKIKILGLSIISSFVLCQAKEYNFNVVSILGEGSTLGVKYGENVKPLTATHFPLFSGSIDADNITQYKYVALDSAGNVIEEEKIDRTYSDQNSGINEVYNRANKDVVIPTLPEPFKPMFPMGSKNFKPFPKDVIYNIYAKCDPETYTYITSNPFDPPDSHKQNKTPSNCTITIISPKSTYESTGTIHIIGYGSRLYKKLTFGMKFDKKFLGRKSVKLRALASDPTLIRENLSIGLYKSVGVPVQEGSYARLFINGDTYGLYTIIDSFSKKWIAGYVHGDAKANIGIAYKIYANVPNYPTFRYVGDNYEDYSTFFVPNEYEDSDVDANVESSKYNHIIEFTKLFDKWVNTPGQPVEELQKFFNIEALLRLMVIDTLILAIDNFYLYLSNAALYYNPERKNYLILPYDFDTVLVGASNDPMIDKVTYIADCHTWVYQHEETIDHYLTKSLLANPEIKKRYDVILAKTSMELFNTKVLSNYVHSVADLIRDDVAWNFEKSTNLGISYDGIVNYYTMEHFEGNLEKTHVVYNKGVINNEAQFGILEWVDLRSNSCIKDTANVDITKNDNISDNLEVTVYMDEESSSSVSIKTTLGVVMIVQILLFTLTLF
jgi:hypothetical protein